MKDLEERSFYTIFQAAASSRKMHFGGKVWEGVKKVF